jgi:hypothetical protein
MEAMSGDAQEIEAIKRLRARYTRAIDTKDWAGLRQSLVDDFTMDSGGRVTEGADALVASLELHLSDAVTVHHAHMPEIELTSPTAATGIWAMEDLVRWPDGRELHGYGHYRDSYEKVDGAWRMKSSALTRLRVDSQGMERVE